MLRIISFLVVFLCLAACREERHFITDTAYRRTVEEDFEHKKQLLSGSQEDLFLIFNQPFDFRRTGGFGIYIRLCSLDGFSDLWRRFFIEKCPAVVKSKGGNALGKGDSGSYFPAFRTSGEGT